MRQVDLEKSVGYALKRAQTALRAAMDSELRDQGLSVPQYSCLELIAHQPALSNAELARGAFVTRQAMHQLLGGLRSAGLVTSEGHGRSERFTLTAAGARRLAGASQAVAAIEERMLAALSAPQRHRLCTDLNACADALTAHQPPSPTPHAGPTAGPS